MAEDSKSKAASSKAAVKPAAAKVAPKAEAPKEAVAPKKSAAKPEGATLNVKAVYRNTVHPGTAQMIYTNRWTPVEPSLWVRNMLKSGRFIQE